MFSLDECLDATTGGPTILSENHDVGSIDWLAGLSDPGEMIACGYLPEARRRAGESDQAYAERLRTTLTADQYEELRARVMPAAIRRASLDTSNGRVNVFVAGAAPWHKLGVNVAEAVSRDHAVTLAGLDWTVSKRELFYQHPVGGEQYLTQEETYGMVRDDTGAFLGSVGSRYVPIQNAEGFDFLDGLMAEFGARYTSAGSLYGGRKVWMLVNLPRQGFEVVSGDKVEPYALFTNVHDGSGQAFCFPTSERVVCGNTFRVASRGRHKGVAMRHTGDVAGRLRDGKEALRQAVAGFEQFQEAATAMVRQPVNVRNYVEDVLDAVLEVTAADALKGADALAAALMVGDAERELKAKEIGRLIERRGAILDDVLQRYESERCGLAGIRGSVWSAFNAITEHADHGNGKRRVGSEEARLGQHFEDVISGDADDVKQAAYSKALDWMSA